MSSPHTLRLGTRGSLLAKCQSATVAAQIQKRIPEIKIETILIKTTGDRIVDKPLYDAGGKGLFIKELEQALLAGEIDFAVHSCKDMPVTMPLVDESSLIVAAIPARHDARDLLVCDRAASIAQLPPNARIGTSSLRRRCQLLHLRRDLRIEPIRGNIDTRIKKLWAGEFDAMVLAVAGIQRAGLMDEKQMHPIPLEELLPAAGQGALALQCRREDSRTLTILRELDDATSNLCVSAERTMVAALNGDCHSPIAAFAQIAQSSIQLKVAVGRRGGELPVEFAAAAAPIDNYLMAVENIKKQLENKGALTFLH